MSRGDQAERRPGHVVLVLWAREKLADDMGIPDDGARFSFGLTDDGSVILPTS